jgi:uncharacterized protein (TIGR02246 family)
MSDDDAAIRKLVDTWMSATKAGDVDAVLDLMTDDAVFLVAGRPPMTKEMFARTAGSGGVNQSGDGRVRQTCRSGGGGRGAMSGCARIGSAG